MNQVEAGANPIGAWVERQIERGYKGFELYSRDGAGTTLLDRYGAERGAADAIFADASGNAAGLVGGASFIVRALNDGSGPHPSRAFSIAPAMPLHEPERFEERNTTRLLLEHIDNQNRVMAQVVPACLAAMGNMVNGLSSHFANLAQTHEAAVRTLRDGKVEALEAERVMLDASRQARIDRLIEAGVAMLPTVIEQFGVGGGSGGSEKP